MTDLMGPASALNSTTSRPTESRTFGGTATWFKGCSNVGVQDGTQVQAVYLNGMLAQLRNAITGLIPVAAQDNSDNMLLKAIQSVQLKYCIDTGAANALAA